MRLRRFSAITLAMLFAAYLELSASPPQNSAAAGPGSVEIVELFTSEGCSSCPPADDLLRQVHLKKTNAGQLIVGISEHVTYWNNLGWKDPYSSPVFTNRQSVYASRLSPEGSYTPQMVMNGREQFVGSDGAALEHALDLELKRPHVDLRIESSIPTATGLEIRFTISSGSSKPLDVIAVLTDDADRSNVLRGENGGRLLQHVSVARSLTRVATVRGDRQESIRLGLPDGFQIGGGEGHHLILFAQEPHQGAIVGAVTIPL